MPDGARRKALVGMEDASPSDKGWHTTYLVTFPKKHKYCQGRSFNAHKAWSGGCREQAP